MDSSEFDFRSINEFQFFSVPIKYGSYIFTTLKSLFIYVFNF